MTHLPFIAASYGLAAVLIMAYSAGAARRLRQAERRLRALDPRSGPGNGHRNGPGSRSGSAPGAGSPARVAGGSP